MNERIEYYQRLIESVRGHFHHMKQTRVNKLTLLKLLYERIDSRETGAKSLTEAYIKKTKLRIAKNKKDGFNRAIRAAVKSLRKWFKEYYDRHPEVPIRFRITKDFVMETIVSDGFDGQSVEQLNEKANKLLAEINKISAEVISIKKGRKPKHADQVRNRLQSLSAKSQLCLLYTSPSPRDATLSRMPSSA